MRTEACACGGSITAPSLAAAAPYVEGHNASAVHKDWRAGRELPIRVPYGLWREKLNRRPPIYRDPRHRTTADSASCDVSGNTTSASAGGEGSR